MLLTQLKFIPEIGRTNMTLQKIVSVKREKVKIFVGNKVTNDPPVSSEHL